MSGHWRVLQVTKWLQWITQVFIFFHGYRSDIFLKVFSFVVRKIEQSAFMFFTAKAKEDLRQNYQNYFTCLIMNWRQLTPSKDLSWPLYYLLLLSVACSISLGPFLWGIFVVVVDCTTFSPESSQFIVAVALSDDFFQWSRHFYGSHPMKTVQLIRTRCSLSDKLCVSFK